MRSQWIWMCWAELSSCASYRSVALTHSLPFDLGWFRSTGTDTAYRILERDTYQYVARRSCSYFICCRFRRHCRWLCVPANRDMPATRSNVPTFQLTVAACLQHVHRRRVTLQCTHQSSLYTTTMYGSQGRQHALSQHMYLSTMYRTW